MPKPSHKEELELHSHCDFKNVDIDVEVVEGAIQWDY